MSKLKLSVPNKLHQYCIGTGGVNIKKIIEVSNSQLKLEGNFIEIEGIDDSSIEIAKKEIFEILSEFGWFYEGNQWKEKLKQDSFFHKYRAEAEKEVEKRNDCFEKSKKAFEKGKKELAKNLSEEGKKHDENFKLLSKQAAQKIFNEM